METKQIIDNLQNECNKLYEEFGATDNVIQLQVAINSLRNEYDIADETKLTESNKGFVQ